MGFRNKSVFFINYFLPLFFYILMGVIMVEINEEFSNLMTVSMILFSIMTATLLTVPNEVVFARAQGVFRSYKIYGVSRLEILSHYSFNSLLNCIITGIIIFFTATPVFGARKISHVPIILLAIFLFFLANMGICFLISTFFTIPKVAGLIAQAIFIPSIVAGGIMIPLETMPENVAKIVRILPSAHVMNVYQIKSFGIKSSAIGCSVITSLIVLLMIALITYSVAFIKFKYNSK